MARKKKNEKDTGLEQGADFVPNRLRAIDIQQQEFSTGFRGYDPADVDEFLDRLTEDYAALQEENKRLKEGSPFPVPGDVNEQAEEILRQAREEADAILRSVRTEADAVASGVSASGSGDAMAAVWPFLTKEREFLRSLASMVQDHAEGIKRQAKDVQTTSTAAKPAAPAAPAPTASNAQGESAWTATAKPSGQAPAPSPAAQDPVVTIPPSSVDTPGSAETQAATKPAEGEEPSLRELFWGEED